MLANEPRICRKQLKWALSEDSRQKGKWKTAICFHRLQDGKKRVMCSSFLKSMSSKKQQIKTQRYGHTSDRSKRCSVVDII